MNVRDYLPLKHIVVAVLATIVALCLSLLFRPVFAPNPYLLFFLAAAIVSVFVSFGAGLVAVILALVLVNVFLLQGRPYTIEAALLDLFRMGLFTTATIFVGRTYQRLRRTRHAQAEASRALGATNRRLADILESINDAFFAIDHEWRFTYVNRRAEEIWQLKRDDLIGRDIWTVFPQAIGTQAYEEQQAAMRDRQPRQFDTFSRVTQGWISVSIFPTESGLSVYFRDIHARKLDEARREFLAHTSAVLASSLDYETTLRQVANLATPDIADWCAIDVLTDDGTIERVAVAHVDPEKVAWAYQLQEQYPVDVNAPNGVPAVLRTGEPEVHPDITDAMIVAAAQTDEDLALLRKIGFRSLVIVPLVARGRTFGAITFVTTNESGRLFSAEDVELALELGQRAGLAVDNARLYSEVEKQRQQLYVTLSSIGDAVIATDAKSRITFINPIAAELTGWEGETAVGRPLHEVFHIVQEDTRKPAESPVEKVLRYGKIVGLANHTLLISRDGRNIPIDDSGAPIRDGSGAIAGVVLVFRDISDRRQVEIARTELLRQERIARKNAEAANDLKLRFLAMVSHELRTPLTSIKGFTSTLLASDVGWDESTQREFLTIMDEEADRLTDLVEQLLDVSRLQAGSLRIELARAPLSDAVHDAMGQLTTLTASHQLVLQVPPDLPDVLIDRQRISQVLVNLVGNAAKFTPDGSPVTIRARRSGDDVQVDVADSGPGIPAEERDDVFEAFRQGERKSGRHRGAGLGLAICKGIVEAHDGRIWIQDGSAPGTTISFTVKVAADAP